MMGHDEVRRRLPIIVYLVVITATTNPSHRYHRLPTGIQDHIHDHHHYRDDLLLPTPAPTTVVPWPCLGARADDPVRTTWP